RHPLPLDQFRRCDDCPDALAFTVEGNEGDWIHVRMKNDRDGYLLARLNQGTSLERQMPEVNFLQGLMGFLRYGAQGAGEETHPSRAMQVAAQAFREYERRDEAAQEPETKAAALQFSGILEFDPGKQDYSEQFDSAYK